MGTIANGVQVIDKNMGALNGTDGTDRTWAMYQTVRTLRGVLGTAVTAGNAGAVAIGSPAMPTNPFGGSAVTPQFRVVGMRIMVPAAITANDTDYATFTVNHYTAAGGSATAVGAASTTTSGTGSLAAYQWVSVSITAANAVMAASGGLGCVITKAGSGVTVPANTLVEVDVVPVA